MRATRRLMASILVFAPALALGNDEPRPNEQQVAPYREAAVLYPGFGSVPWHAAFSPDGRFVAVVEGHPVDFVMILDAGTREQLARFETEIQPASHVPAFTRDGERLVLIEGDALVVRTRDADWRPSVRVPLPFRPGITRRQRPLVLSPDERNVVFVDDGRAWRVDLAEAKVKALEPTDAFACHFVGARLAVARWSDGVAQTVVLDPAAEEPETLPFALLAASPDGRTWLVAMEPRVEGRSGFEFVDSSTHQRLAGVPIGLRHLFGALFSPDGAHLVTIEGWRSGSVWDARTGARLQRITAYEGDRLIGLAFSPDGRFLVTSGRRAERPVHDRAVLLWRRDAAAPSWRDGLRTALFERTSEDGTVHGHRRLDPLLTDHTRYLLAGASQETALRTLDAFRAALAEGPPLSPLERALLQRDLWAVWTWAAEERPHAGEAENAARGVLAERLGAAIAGVALTEAEIAALPDTFALAASTAPAAYDPGRPGRAFLPADLLDDDGPWVCLGDGEKRLLAPFHMRKFHGRAAFSVHVRLPGGREDTLGWIEGVRAALVANDVGAVPDPPRGTLFALVRRGLLIDDTGRVRRSPLVERIQLRVHGSRAGQAFFESDEEDAVFEWRIDASGLVAGRRHGLLPVGPAERDFVFFEEGHGGDAFEGQPWEGPPTPLPRLHSCAACHAAHFGALRIQSVTHSLGPLGPLPLALEPSTTAAQDEIAIRFAENLETLDRLQRAFAK